MSVCKRESLVTFECEDLTCEVISHEIITNEEDPLTFYMGAVGVPECHPLFGISHTQTTNAYPEDIEILNMDKFSSEDEEAFADWPEDAYLPLWVFFNVRYGISHSGHKNIGTDESLWWFGFNSGVGDRYKSKNYMIQETIHLAEMLAEWHLLGYSFVYEDEE